MLIEGTVQWSSGLTAKGEIRNMTPTTSSRRQIPHSRALRRAVSIALYGSIGALGSIAQLAYADDPTEPLSEVVVTATGRKQSIQDVPYNISALSGEQLQDANVSDYYSLAKVVPGVAFADVGPRGGLANSLIIRGISVNSGASPVFPDPTQPTVSTYIDSTPIFANLRVTDLDRVEILRGPQGTLYGADSSGGTIRFIYNKPQFDAFTAKVSGGAGYTDGASGLNSQGDLTLNIPLSDTLAVRLSGGRERNAGFIDAPNRYVLDSNGDPALRDPADPINSPGLRTAASGVNWDSTTTARGALRWRPSDVFDAQLSYNYQSQASGGPSLVSYQAFGQDSRTTDSQVAEPFQSSVDLAALETETQLGFATLTSSSSYYETRARAENDFTGFYLSFPFYTAVYGNSPRFLATGTDEYNAQGFVQEFRLASETVGPLKWVTGLFYQRRRTQTVNEQYTPGYSDFYAACSADPLNTRPCGLGTFYPQITSFGTVQNAQDFAYLNDSDVLFKEAAAYAELEWRIAQQWRLTGGIRGYHQNTSNDEVGGLLFLGPTGVGAANLSTSQQGALYKGGLSYDITPEAMLYAIYSEGMRPAGINGLPATVYNFDGSSSPTNPALFQYRSDKVDNREIGIKGTVAHRFDYTLTYFNMLWNDVQVGTQVTALEIGAVINAGDARSQGVELETHGALTEHLSASVGYTHVDAVLTSVNPPAGVDPGSYSRGAKLPGVPDQMGSIGLQYTQPLGRQMVLTYDMEEYYRGRSASQLLISQDTVAGGFATFDPSIALSDDRWSVKLLLRNAFNRDGVYGYTPANWGNWAGASIARPRTLALIGTYNFR
jgi:iron complex outermembrane recepter protein